MTDNIEEILPLIIYADGWASLPGVRATFRQTRGLYVTARDRAHIPDILDNWPYRDVRVIVITDGERALGARCGVLCRRLHRRRAGRLELAIRATLVRIVSRNYLQQLGKLVEPMGVEPTTSALRRLSGIHNALFLLNSVRTPPDTIFT